MIHPLLLFSILLQLKHGFSCAVVWYFNTESHWIEETNKSCHTIITTHLFFIERADWPKVHDMFKARDAIAWQREFPVGFPLRVCASNLIFINIFLDIVARMESRCVIEAKHVLLVCLFVRFSLEKLRNCDKSNELTDQQDMFHYRTLQK